MTDKIEKFAARHQPEPDAYVALARVVRTLEGSKRFRVPVGTPIQGRPEMLKKLEKGTKINPETGRVENEGASGSDNHKLFAMRVEELKKSVEKLDKAAIQNLIDQLERTENLPKSENYQKIRDMLKSYLKDKKEHSSVSEKFKGK